LPNFIGLGLVGSVIPSCEIRLVDWNEGGYRATDKPNPRGEIYIGGECVTLGYYEMPEKTAEDYITIDGIRYFKSGDIGELLPIGSFKIIDRKKDLVKLSGGEYISLNKVESCIKLLAFVDNCCVVSLASKPFCACIISPNQSKLVELLKEHANTDLASSSITDDLIEFNNLENENKKSKFLIEILEKNQKLCQKLADQAIEQCSIKNLANFEIPRKFKFVAEIWLPDSGLVTDSFKIKRRSVEIFYKDQLEKLFE
jgi:long-chain acyl-CoA synthetase